MTAYSWEKTYNPWDLEPDVFDSVDVDDTSDELDDVDDVDDELELDEDFDL